MASHNKIMLIGAVQDTPDVKATTSGHALAKFTLKVPRIESLPNEAFDFIRIVAWRERADACAQFQKNDAIYVEGRILVDSYEDTNSGQRKWTTEVEARQLVKLSDVFSGAHAAKESPNAVATSDAAAFNSNMQAIDTPDISESDFFKHEPMNENELEEDVPF